VTLAEVSASIVEEVVARLLKIHFFTPFCHLVSLDHIAIGALIKPMSISARESIVFLPLPTSATTPAGRH